MHAAERCGCCVSVPSAADGVPVPVELAPVVARILHVGVMAALLDQRETGERRIPAAALLELVRRLEAVTATGHEIGQRPRLVSTIDTAARLAVSERTVRRWCQTGQLAAHRAGRAWLVEEGAVTACQQT